VAAVVGERLGFAEGIENGGGVVVETAMRRIGSGEIKDWRSRGAEFLECLCVTVGRELPVGALREHGEKRDHSTANREGG